MDFGKECLRFRVDLTDNKNGAFLEVYYNGNLILKEKAPVLDEDGQIVDFMVYEAIVIPEACVDEFFEKLERIKKEREDTPEGSTLLTISRTETGLGMSMAKLYDIETDELEKMREWLGETLQEIEEELEERKEYGTEEEEE